MVALLVFIMARAIMGPIMALDNGYFGDSFWPKNTVGRKRSIWR